MHILQYGINPVRPQEYQRVNALYDWLCILGGELSKNEADRGLLLKLKANGGKKSKPKKTELGNYKLMFYS